MQTQFSAPLHPTLARAFVLIATFVLGAGLGCSSDSSTESGAQVVDLRVEGSLVAAPDGGGGGVINRGAGPTQLRAIAELEDGTTDDVTTEAEWALVDPTRATVDMGLITPIEPGRSDVQVTFGGITTTAPFFVVSRISGIPPVTIEGTVLGVIQFDGPGDSKQLVATTRLPDGSVLDVTDEVPWTSSNPVAFPISEGGVAEAAVEQAASDVSVVWRDRRGTALLRVGAPLPEPVAVTVTAIRLFVPFSCDSATNADGGDGEFSYEIHIILPDGTRVPIQATPDYPDPDEVVLIDTGDLLNLDGSVTVEVLDYQSIEVELRVTEWDREFVDLGDIIPDSDMSDASVTKIHRGAEGFDSGQSEIEIVGSPDCEIRLDYRVGTMR